MPDLASQVPPTSERALWRALIGPLVYSLMLAAGVASFFAIRSVGETLQAPAASLAESSRELSESAGKVDVVFHVLATLAAIIILGQLFGRVLRWFGQPPVIGEVLAGLVLGPSLLGTWSPQLAHLFVPGAEADPAGIVVSALTAISRLGVILYMFLIGLELNLPQLRSKAHTAIAISHASILVPFLLGAALALGIYPLLSSADVTFTSFALFMGAAMAITAFPVLARILSDQKLEKTELGVIALSCAATDDITAWCLLAFVIGMAQSQLSDAMYVLLGAVGYVVVMFILVRPLAHRILRRFDDQEFPAWIIPAVLVAVMLSALTTKVIGIHSLFGGFTMGVVLSSNDRLNVVLRSKFHDIATILLLPAFFAITGLRTQINLLDNSSDWLLAGAIILVATVGKVGGTIAAARLTGMGWRDASALGALMNTRGLMELIALNIGLEIGIISPRLFAMMVVMALVTTLATAPVLRWVIRPEAMTNERIPQA
jgi:Kef-type K+ transport system membrane component KefB